MASSDDDCEYEDEGEDSVQAIRIPLGHPPVLFGLPLGFNLTSLKKEKKNTNITFLNFLGVTWAIWL